MSQDNQLTKSTSLSKTDTYWCTPLIRYLKESAVPANIRLAKKLADCAQYRRFGLKSGKKPNFCNQRFLCEYCSKADSKRAVEAHAGKLLDLILQHSLCPLWLTLSPPVGESLPQALTRLNRILGKVRQQRKNHFSHGKRFTEFCRFQYALMMLEVKRTQDQQLWFPHVHAITLNPLNDRLFNLPDLVYEWTAISESSVRPYVEATTAGKLLMRFQTPSQVSLPVQEKMRDDLRRLIRYSLKFIPFNPSDQLAVYSAMRGQHRIREWRITKPCQIHSRRA